MTIPKGKTLSETGKADAAELKRREEEYAVLIEQKQEEIRLRKEAFEIQKKGPKKVNPDFEYETTDEWSEILIKQWEYDVKRQVALLENDIKELTKRKLVVGEE